MSWECTSLISNFRSPRNRPQLLLWYRPWFVLKTQLCLFLDHVRSTVTPRQGHGWETQVSSGGKLWLKNSLTQSLDLPELQGALDKFQLWWAGFDFGLRVPPGSPTPQNFSFPTSDTRLSWIWECFTYVVNIFKYRVLSGNHKIIGLERLLEKLLCGEEALRLQLKQL